MVNNYGLYYSKLDLSDNYLPAMKNTEGDSLAHFGGSSFTRTIQHIKGDAIDWAYTLGHSIVFLLPKDLIVWQNQ